MRTLAELARHLNLSGSRPPLVLVTDERRLPDPCPAAARLPPGSLVILRHYDTPDRRALAGRLARLCRARRLRLLIAADLDLAVALGTGLHLPEGLARSPAPRLRLWHRRSRLPLTVAAHGRMALVRAARLGADAALLSPVFATASHPEARGLGAVAFRRLVRRAKLPVYALGGVNRATVGHLKGSGAAGVAAISGFCRGAMDHGANGPHLSPPFVLPPSGRARRPLVVPDTCDTRRVWVDRFHPLPAATKV